MNSNKRSRTNKNGNQTKQSKNQRIEIKRVKEQAHQDYLYDLVQIILCLEEGTIFRSTINEFLQ
jgi:hypothetical protein